MIKKNRFDEYAHGVRELMDTKRFRHTMAVAYTAQAMAMAFGEDYAQAGIAGLLHDCAKQLGDQRLLRICQKNNIPITDCERRNVSLLHAKAGAAMAASDFGVTDEAILSAIRYHTTGRPGMTRLEQIIFLADYIEPGRYRAPRLPEVRQMAFKDLDECCYMVLDSMMAYLAESEDDLDMTTKEAYDYYKFIHEKKQEDCHE
ncbi:MAG: bis(5'-nucleosyl)-tetraphosphatase (symmetrical) YqeK [Lachnospiraceae bacterium]|nr:bis(5'-nucleosyl)-tetraphosphatase (symmetrical) YqeK [Lachnospiraceae bacterium]